MPEEAVVSVGRDIGASCEDGGERKLSSASGIILTFSGWPVSLLVDSIEVKDAGNSGTWSEPLRMLLLWRRDSEINGYCCGMAGTDEGMSEKPGPEGRGAEDEELSLLLVAIEG